MNRKAELEFKSLVKLGVSEDMAKLIAISKYNPGSEESKYLIDDEKDFQNDIKNSMLEFIRVEDSTRENNLLFRSEEVKSESK
jgi:hypothetical protein